ncbi:MAG: tRNA (adenosine(37)-N6)-threonylcarbamoyltransferase complex ATPase subunit type 1 TsaE [Weeksellaceae bacterium]|nr:tRNA (adenosine(37)-N6)-threonylcarbamoyltransferase complex ATPase subunit type 1 TsaE [Weeksellaceae bacterium]
MEWTVHAVEELPEVAEQILSLLTETTLCFEGEMGAGKTTLIRSMIECLGSEDVVSSPTFALVAEYETKKGLVYHFDFYRIDDIGEVYDMGFEEYLYSGNPCWIEWSNKILTLLPENRQTITIEKLGTKRKITLS